MTEGAIWRVGQQIVVSDRVVDRHAPGIRISLLTAGQDGHYSYGLTMGLIGRGVHIDFVGNDEVDGPEQGSETDC